MKSMFQFLRTKKRYIAWVLVFLALAVSAKWFFKVAVPVHPPITEAEIKHSEKERKKYEIFKKEHCESMSNDECLSFRQRIRLESRASEYGL